MKEIAELTPDILVSLSWETAMILLLIFLINLIFNVYFVSFFKKRGQDSASLKAIERLTEKVEEVKIEYSKRLEEIRSQIEFESSKRKFVYENEYQILRKISESVTDVEVASIKFRARMAMGADDSYDKLIAFAESMQKNQEFLLQVSPFIPDDIAQKITSYVHLINGLHLEASELQPDETHEKARHWFEKDFSRIQEERRDIHLSIRNRVSEWQQL